MRRGVCKYLVGSIVLVALIGVAGCTHYFFAEREPWRHEAEVACLKSGVAQEIPGRVRVSAIEGPGACGIDYPLMVSQVGEGGPLSYDDAPPIPPAAIPQAAQPRWPVNAPGQSAAPAAPYTPLPPSDVEDQSQHRPPQYDAGQAQYGARWVPQSGAPMSLSPPDVASEDEDPDASSEPPHRYYPPANAGRASAPLVYGAQPRQRRPDESAVVGSAPVPPLGPPAPPPATVGPVGLRPAAMLGCPIVAMLDKWVATAVQPAALKWFRQPAVEIKQIGSYSCRGINGNPTAHISEHAFGNALDIAEFDLADGHRISVQYGWRGTPEEQGFLHDVQLAACREFTTVLAPGANIYHYNHIHVDLMRRPYRPYVCEPAAIPGEIAAARARAHYAAQRGYGYGGITGSIRTKARSYARGTAPEDKDRLPFAGPGDD